MNPAIWIPVIVSIVVALLSLIYSLIIYGINAKVRGVEESVKVVMKSLSSCQIEKTARITEIETHHEKLVEENGKEHKEMMKGIYELKTEVAIIKTILQIKYPAVAKQALEKISNGG